MISWRRGPPADIAVEGEARRLGYQRLHAGSGRAAPLFERAGWTELERVSYHGEVIAILRRDLDRVV